MTIACGDSHTSTHGAFGAVAFGIGTSQVRDVLASQCLAMEPLKVRRIDVNGRLAPRRLREGRHPRDHPPARRKGGVGYAYEYARRHVDAHVDGRADDDLQHVDRRRRARRLRQPRRDDVRLPARPAVRAAGRRVRRAPCLVVVDGLRPGRARTTTDVEIDAAAIRPTVTWGINPGQSVAVDEPLPPRAPTREALAFMGFRAGQRMQGTQIDVAFVGSCTNARLSDLREAARVVRGHHVAPHVKALVVPGSQAVRAAAEREGSIASSSTPASNGAAPAARCAWR